MVTKGEKYGKWCLDFGHYFAIYAATFWVDSVVAVAAGVLLLLCVLRKQELRRPAGIIMLLGYADYFVYLMIG